MQKSKNASRRTQGLALLVLTVCLGLPAYAFWKISLDRYGELHAIEDRLRAQPGVKLTRSWGNEDITFEDICARVEVQGKGPIEFWGLELASFEGHERFHVSELGPLHVVSCVWGYQGVRRAGSGERVKTLSDGSGFTVGNDGDFTALFPFPMQTPVDVIAHYDDINEVLSTWPRAPAFREFRTKDGELIVRYAVTDDPNVSLESACKDLQGT